MSTVHCTRVLLKKCVRAALQVRTSCVRAVLNLQVAFLAMTRQGKHRRYQN
jgi:hypothetical protein